MTLQKPPIRVFLVDDSAVSRLAFSHLIRSQPDMRLVGEAENGKQAVQRIPGSRPDIVLMDIVMPIVDGLEATQRLMEIEPVPILLISDLVGRRADLNFDALRAGAVDLVRKPSRQEIKDPSYSARLVRKIRNLAGVPVVKRRFSGRTTANPVAEDVPARSIARLLLGASTGGPVALAKVLQALAPRPPWPVLVVQHISTGFVDGLARWLETSTGCPVGVVESACRLQPGVVYLAPDDRHLVLAGRDAGRDRVELRREPAELTHRPSIDVLFDSAVESGLGPDTLAALLTGMGKDGARGLLHLRQADAWTLIQDQDSSVVFGMPRAARDLGAACEELPIDAIGPRLLRLSTRRASRLRLETTAT